MKPDILESYRMLANVGQQGKKSEAIRVLCDEIQKLQRRRTAARGFSLSEVMAEAERRNWKPGDAEAFFDHYEMVGWIYGKGRHPIRKLPNAMSTWERNRSNGSVETKSIGQRYAIG